MLHIPVGVLLELERLRFDALGPSTSIERSPGRTLRFAPRLSSPLAGLGGAVKPQFDVVAAFVLLRRP